MQAIINPGKISGAITPPPSKSMMQRVCAAALLHKGTTVIYNPGTSRDDQAALGIIQRLGAITEHKSTGEIEIFSRGVFPSQTSIDCGESGLSTRLFTPIAALSNEHITITGHGSLLQRPMYELGNILSQLGVALTDFNGFLPLQLHGPVIAQNIVADGSLSSQYLTGILFALAFTTEKPVTVTVKDLKSKPYIDLSLKVLADFGIAVTNEDYQAFLIAPVQQKTVQPVITQVIESDWSSAAAWIVAGAISGSSIVLDNIDIYSTQADRMVLDAVQAAGAVAVWRNGLLHIRSGGQQLHAFVFDATHCPDLFPVLSVLAACCKGESIIKGLHRLTFKESDRQASICHMLQQLGVSYVIQDDNLVIKGRETLQSATIDSFNDHRIVMAAAIAAAKSDGPVTINNAAAVNKSYPAFFNDLRSLGIAVQTSGI
ncbi:3-phosphoshikimate 1-carboxyvinyltransferase [Chitinophagaceae bacterium MMS25-I14]